jgi:predicted amidohydrolase
MFITIRAARGRVFETVIGIAVANYPVPRCDGHSFAVDASGRIIAMADAGAALVRATFDLAAIGEARREQRFRWQI